MWLENDVCLWLMMYLSGERDFCILESARHEASPRIVVLLLHSADVVLCCVHNLLLDAFPFLSHFRVSKHYSRFTQIFIFSKQLQHVSTEQAAKHLCLYATYYDLVFRFGSGSYCMSICVENGHLFRQPPPHKHSHQMVILTAPPSLVVSIIWFCRLRCHLFRGFLLECCIHS